MNQPLVSVIMPVYNGADYIREAVDSVFRQEVLLELLVIDDGSTDQTEEVLAAYLCREDFRYLKIKKIWEQQPPATAASVKQEGGMWHFGCR